MTAISFDGVDKTFGATVALADFRLDIEPGEFVSLLGPSGCGKTTALRILAGFERADGGVVRVGGNDVTSVPAHRRNMGMVFQSYSLFPNLTVAGNVEYGLRTRRIDAPVRRQRVGEMLELVELGGLAQRYPHQLSGGQQQRVALARALAVQPEVLLLDEPLSALDARVRLTLRDEIRRIQQALGITTLFVTHDQEEALGISDRVGVMSNGRLEQIDRPAEVYGRPVNAFVARFVGSMNELPGVVLDERAIRIGGAILEVDHGLRRSAVVRALVRPEDVTVHDPSDVSAPEGLVGSVVSTTFQGAASVIDVRVDVLDTLVRSLITGVARDELAPGTRVALSIVPGRVLVEHVADDPTL
jgi:putative spermidine/putrescine transport system ATP-binding protein